MTKHARLDHEGYPIEAQSDILRDGERISVQMPMMDHSTIFADGIRHLDALTPHKPGSMATSDAERGARVQQLDEREEYLNNAWRGSANPVVDVTEFKNPDDLYENRKFLLSEAWKKGPPPLAKPAFQQDALDDITTRVHETKVRRHLAGDSHKAANDQAYSDRDYFDLEQAWQTGGA